MKNLTVIVTLILSLLSNVINAHGDIRFVENKGQWVNSFLYKANVGGGALFVEKFSFTYNFYNIDSYQYHHANFSKQDNKATEKLKFHAFKVNFLNASSSVKINTLKPYPEYFNYFLGKDKSKWKSKVKAYEVIKYNNLYPNIDLELYSIGRLLKYDVIVNPQGKIKDVQLQYDGVNQLIIDKKGNLKITTSVNEIVEQKPYAYQLIDGKKNEVPCKFTLKQNIVSFKVLKKYDKSIPLIIDPVLIFGSYSGSSADNFGMTATYGSDGSLFAGGTTFNVGYPTTVGAYDTTFAGTPAFGISDIAISRYTPDGDNLIYSTYLGGVEAETVHSLIATDNNELYLYGVTGSIDFPVLTNAYDTTFGGGPTLQFPSNGTVFNIGTDIYVTKLDATGSNLLASTYIGGTANDGVNHTVNQVYDSLMNNYGDQYRGEIMLDKNENCYITSSTKSTDFPTPNGFDNTLNGHQDGVVFKFNTDLTNLLWGTYLGGDNADAGYSIKVDTAHTVYVSGGTSSNNFPTTPGTIDTAFIGSTDGFLTKIDSNGSAILASTYIGTTAYDQCYFIEIDRFGSVYTVGQTEGTFPIINAPYSTPNSGSFVMKLTNDLDSTIYSSVFGNGSVNAPFSPSAFLVDKCENVYVSGWGGNILTGATLTGMDTTTSVLNSAAGDAISSTGQDGFNFYLTVIERNMQSILYGTYYGGNTSREHVDGGTSRFDKNGIVYQSVCAGCNTSNPAQGNNDFPTTTGAWSNTNNSNNCNNGVFKFDFEIVPKAQFTVDNYEGCAPLTVHFTNNSNSSDTYLWDFGGGDTTSTEYNPIRTYNTPGTYSVALLITDSICNTVDTAFQVITVDTAISVITTNTITTCDTVTLHASFTGNVSSFIWSSNNQFTDTLNTNLSDSSLFVTGTGTVTYFIMATNGVCTEYDSVIVSFNPVPQANFTPDNLLGCTPLTVNFTNISDPTDGYLWNFGGNDTTSQIFNPIRTFSTPGNYIVTLIISDSICNIKDTSTVTIIVKPQVTVNASNTIDICDTTTIYVTSTGDATTYIWSSNNLFTDTINSDLTDSTLFVSPNDTTVYYVLVSNGACSAIDSVHVNYIGVDVSIDPASTCLGNSDTLNLVNNNNQTLTYQWSPISEIISGSTTPNPIVNPDSTMWFYVTIQSNLGCTYQDSVQLIASGFHPDSILVTADQDTLVNGEGTYLHASPTTGFGFEWTPNIALNSITSANPYANPTSTITYTVWVTELNSNCRFPKTYTLYAWEVLCGEPEVYLPNAFTPNADNENDVLFLRGRNVAEMHLSIYDRWGELVFETEDQKIGWDGKFKDELVIPGVFVYHLKVKCIDGQDYFKKGNVTVIR